MSRVRLFDEFPAVSTEEWEEQIRQDLRGRDYGETLLWHHPDGITARPYYRAEDVSALEKIEPEAAQDAVAVPIGWKLRQDIRTPEIETAARQARAAIDADVDILGIDLRIEGGRCKGVPLLQRADFERFLCDVPLAQVDLHLDGGALSPGLLAFYLDHVGKNGSAAAFSLGFDPVGEAVRAGKRLDGMLDLAADMIGVVSDKQHPEARVVTAGSGVYHDAGATPVQQTALLLGAVSELLVQMIERGVRAEQVLGRLSIGTRIGSSYFVEIARLRALRILLRQLADVFVPGDTTPLPPIHGETPTRNRTLYDPHENLLRSTTEAASAVVGGCDVVVVHPFDDVAGRYDEFSYRMARNIQHLLRFEGGFGRVADPAAGSYYVEVLTDAIARRSWQLFQDVESKGGFLEALQNGFVHELLEGASAERRMAVATRRAVLVGTNHYPNSEERRSGDVETNKGVRLREDEGGAGVPADFEEVRIRVLSDSGLHALASIMDGHPLSDPLRSERLAEPVERRRLRTERHDREVRILLVPFGDPAIRSARSNFAATFLGCGGFLIDAPLAFESGEEISQAVRDARPDVVVYCADDIAYPTILAEGHHHVGSGEGAILRGIVARPEVIDQLKVGRVDFSIHRGSNLLAVIDDLHQRLGVTAATSATSLSTGEAGT